MSNNNYDELGYFGNIWVRANILKKAGDTNGGGHKHHFDHVSLLVRGSVRLDVDGYPSKVFTAPRFIVVKKELKHRFTALEDDTVYYCVFALRDVDGNVTDIYSGDNSPYGSIDDEDVIKNLKVLEDKTTNHS
jgi:hypothetical protein